MAAEHWKQLALETEQDRKALFRQDEEFRKADRDEEKEERRRREEEERSRDEDYERRKLR